MTQTMYTLDGHQALSVQERLRAASDGLRAVGTNAEDVVRLLLGIAIVALAACIAMYLAARVRRARWIGRQQRSLRSSGLLTEEVDLFGDVARCADALRVPLLIRQRAAFDFAAAEHVRRHSPASDRREELSRVLSLRRRIPFDQRWQAAPPLARGTPVRVMVRLDARNLRQFEGAVLGTPPHALQIGLQVGKDDSAIAQRLRTGQEVMLVVRHEVALQEAHVRIRGRCIGRTLQILVDRPAALAPSRVRIAWHGADEHVPVEMVERYSERLVGDEVPRHDAVISATSGEGIVLQFRNVRPRHGEAIRVVAGSQAGFYRGFAVLAASGKGGEVFVLRRQGERGSERSETVAAAEDRAGNG
jgi:hypothetical protein